MVSCARLRIERSKFEPGTLVRDIVLCICSRHFALAVPLPTQVYKWVPANLIPAMALHPIQRGVEMETNFSLIEVLCNCDFPLSEQICMMYLFHRYI